MNKWIEILIGLVLLIVPVAIWSFWGLGAAALAFLKGGIMWFLLLMGLIFLILGLMDLKD